MNATVFSNVTIQDGGSIRIYALLENNCLDVTILKNENAWKKVLHWGDLEAIASVHDLNLEDYCEKLLDYLKCSSPNIEFTLQNNDFVVSRHLESGLKANYIELTEEILDKFYSENLKTSTKLDETIKKCGEYKQHEEACESKLKELLERKKTHDDELFNHFMLILNEKKARIKHLSELLEASENGKDLLVRKAPVKGKGRKRKNVEVPKVSKREVISESEPEEQEDLNTDEEVETKNNIHRDNIEQSTTSILDMFTDNPSASTQAENDKIKAEIDKIKEENVEEETTALLDIFFDAPSTSGLSKRQKVCKEKNIEVLVAPKVDSKDSGTPLEPVTRGRKTPVIELNTQQLLDML